MKKQFTFRILIPTLLLLATTLVIFYGKGYRFGLGDGRPDFFGTGLLVVTSEPNGAQVFVDGHLTTATDNTLNLTPGDYTIKIFKDGYFPWEKKLKVRKEVVTKADTLLFPTTPKLEGITNVGVRNPVLDPSRSRLAYAVASQSARKNGIYILDLTNRPILTLQSSSTQITDDTLDQFSNSSFAFSPDGSELIATTSALTTYLFNTNDFNSSPQDVTATLTSIDLEWQKQRSDKEKARLDALPSKLRQLVLSNFNILEWPLDDSKILYEASASATLPTVINPRLVGVDETKEQRKLEKGSIYVYDIKEDTNYKIDVKSKKNLHWFPDSSHLIYVADQKIRVMDSDGSNKTTVYAGPFVDGFAFPWPDGSKIIILTDLGNPDIIPNLYKIVLK